MQPPPEFSADVVAAYREAQADLARQLKRIEDDPNYWRRQGRIAQLQRVTAARLDEANGVLASWLSVEFPLAYELGAAAAAAVLGNTFGWSVAHTRAVESLAADTFDDFLGRTQFVNAETKKLLREIGGKLSRLTVTTDRTAKGAARELVREAVQRHGIAQVIYRDGSRHAIGEWAEVALRTKTAVAYTEGTFNWSTEHGVTYYEVFDGPQCGWTFHEDGELALGKIVTEAEAREHPIAHPNCRRAFGPRPDVRSEQGAARATRNTTPEQREAQLEADRLARESRTANRLAVRAARLARRGDSATG